MENRLQRVRECGTRNRELHTSYCEMDVVPAWYAKTVNDSRLRLAFCLLAGGALRRRTCCGRARNERPVVPRTSRSPRSVREHAPARCAAIPDCRKFRSAHKANPEADCGAREIALRKIHTARAERRRHLAGSQRLSCAGSAGISNYGTMDKRAPSPGFSISPEWAGTLKHGKKQTLCQARYNENPKE